MIWVPEREVGVVGCGSGGEGRDLVSVLERRVDCSGADIHPRFSQKKLETNRKHILHLLHLLHRLLN